MLADTQHLHEKIEAMSKRISELEDALAILQAQISNETHPLLTDTLRLVKAPPPTQNVAAHIRTVSDLISDRFGTLILGENAHFFGQNASADEDSALEPPSPTRSLPLDILFLSEQFPMTNVSDARDAIIGRLAAWLPAAPQAWGLVEIYFRDATWLFFLISKEEFMETIFAHVYADVVPSAADITPHELALVFMIFCIACMVDLNRQPCNTEAETYYQLARAAMGVDSVIDHPTIQAVRALHLMSTYPQMCETAESTTTVYGLVGLNAQICKSLGLHRDDTHWQLSDVERQRRRHLFWEVASYDLWCSMAFGRPPSFTLSQVDAKLPAEDYGYLDSEAQRQASFLRWHHHFTRAILFKIAEQAFGLQPLTYAMVLRLDKLVREQPLGEDLTVVNAGEHQPGIPTWLLLQRSAIYSLSQKILLFLHRSFFARALMEAPADPLKSQWAQSVLTVFRAAYYISANIRALHTQAPIMLRFWIFPSQCLTAALVLGSIVLKAPACGLAPPAWTELNELCALMESVAPVSRRIAHILPNVRRLKQAAQSVYAAYTASASTAPHSAERELVWKDIKFLYGHSRLVDNAAKSASGGTGDSSKVSPGSGPSFAAPPDPACDSTCDPATLITASATLTTGEAGNSRPGFPDVATVPLDDLFASLNASFWSTTDPSHAGGEQLGVSLDFSALCPLPELPLDALIGPSEADMTSIVAEQQPAGSSATMDTRENRDSPMLLAPPLEMMPPSNLDLPWQRFMSGIGFDDRQLFYHDQDGGDLGPAGSGL